MPAYPARLDEPALRHGRHDLRQFFRAGHANRASQSPAGAAGRPAFWTCDDRRVEIREGAGKRISVRLVTENERRHGAAQPSQRAVLTFEGYPRTEITRLVARFSDATGDNVGRPP